MTRSIGRSQFIAGSAALAAVAAVRTGARAADFALKIGVDLPTEHPTVAHLRAVASDVAKRTNGRVSLAVFPNSQLGNDSTMLAQVRTGAIDLMAVGNNILATLVPAAAAPNVGFAWKDAKTALAASDGALGAYVRGEIAKTGLHVFEKIWDEGFRQTTASTHPIRTADDYRGFKIRVPPSPISTSLFAALGAAPTTINAAEMYSALQTHLVDGEENPLGTIAAHRLSEVQKYCSLTNHMWVGYWILMNGGTFDRLPAELRAQVAAAFDEGARAQRADVARENATIRAKLAGLGMIFNETTPETFRKKLATAGFYKQWRGAFGDEAWSRLERYAGPLG